MKKILLVVDVYGWAFDASADAIIQHNRKHHVEKKLFSELQSMDFDKYDLVHIMSWALGKHWLHKKNLSTDVSACWYKYRGDTKENYKSISRFPFLFGKSDEIVTDLIQHNPRIKLVHNAVDDVFFYPKPKKTNTPIKIGWVGNNTAGTITPEGLDIKGYHSLLEPFIRRNQDKYAFKLNTNNYKTAITQEEMRRFYQDIDVLLCTSWSESTPRPVLEAIMCDIPIISTNVGCLEKAKELSPDHIYLVDIKQDGNWKQPNQVIPKFEKILTEIKLNIKHPDVVKKYFGWSSAINRYIEYYDACLKQLEVNK